ncbi:ABC transporter substrate-binding protein [Pseudodesulfovibrio sp. zrk46]|uniref:ABC transporter substrate-binding protein n=1 Tax=Pseudodesulfovibrio sp. zrk46 TaxID=2725288 RepID=UPI001448C0B4|nr:ABC transporter substrate-binding protein [Pseudodesulfovibrio sp. zrk46]QJB57749.1 ABC transporter substrate-binding protein [Pseudodesulfovibrio sp. zrk46]
MSDLGVYARNGAILAVETINLNGGINGRPLKLLSEDDLNTPNGALNADTKLIETGVVAIVGHMTSSQTMAVMPIVNETGIVMISPTTSTPALSRKADSFFRTMVENTLQSKELADYARSALDIATVVSVAEADNKSYSFTFRDGFIQRFKEVGGTISGITTYSSSNAPNWDTITDMLIETNPDAVLLTCPAQDVVSIVQRIRDAGLKTRILSGAWAYTDNLLDWGGQYAEGIIFVIDFAADNPNPEFIKFREAYRNRFGRNPNFASAFSYEAVQALANALEKTNGSSEGLADAMAPSNIINGVISPFKLNEFGDVERNVFIVTVQEGQFRTVEMR